MEPNTREAMTPEPEMTLKRAREIVRKNSIFESNHVYELAEMFLAGHAAGLKESPALVKELAEALESITDCYVKLVLSGDAGNWNPELDGPVIKSRKALESARRTA